jgi:putative acetyltransferase
MNPTDTITLRAATRTDSAAVRRLVEEVLGEFGFSLEPDGTDADLENLEASYTAPGGMFELLEDNEGRLLGCVGLYPLLAPGDATRRTCELRKMYLRPEARGHGLGRRLLERALRRAAELGFAVVVLETASNLTDAIALYIRYGFVPYQPAHQSCRCDRAYRLELSPPSA